MSYLPQDMFPIILDHSDWRTIVNLTTISKLFYHMCSNLLSSKPILSTLRVHMLRRGIVIQRILWLDIGEFTSVLPQMIHSDLPPPQTSQSCTQQILSSQFLLTLEQINAILSRDIVVSHSYTNTDPNSIRKFDMIVKNIVTQGTNSWSTITQPYPIVHLQMWMTSDVIATTLYIPVVSNKYPIPPTIQVVDMLPNIMVSSGVVLVPK